jgi:hypothetical protein
VGRDGQRPAGDLPQTAMEIFLRRGLDTRLTKSPAAKISFGEGRFASTITVIPGLRQVAHPGMTNEQS